MLIFAAARAALIACPCGQKSHMTYTVYILKCNDNSLYVGCTKNIEERIKEHNKSKKGAHYTKIRRPVILMHTEEYTTLKEARKREAEIKKWRREEKLKLITGVKNKDT